MADSEQVPICPDEQNGDVWGCFFDEWCNGPWRVIRKSEYTFESGFGLNTKHQAEKLMSLLNQLERKCSEKQD